MQIIISIATENVMPLNTPIAYIIYIECSSGTVLYVPFRREKKINKSEGEQAS